jgi:hypothetical protein
MLTEAFAGILTLLLTGNAFHISREFDLNLSSHLIVLLPEIKLCLGSSHSG